MNARLSAAWSRRRVLRTGVGLAGAVATHPLLAACGAAPAPAAPAAAPAATSAPTGWDSTIAAAKQEGTLLLSGPPGQAWRDALALFNNEYPEVRIEFTGQNSRDFWPRLDQERAADQYLWDLRVGGFGQESFPAKDDGVLEPVRPALVLPEVVDDSKWLGGLDGRFADKQKQYLFGFFANAAVSILVNRDLLPEPDLTSGRDLLDPRWKGKIVLQDPRSGNGGATMATIVIAYGEQFVRDLLATQEIAITGDNRQQVEWVVRGRYPIGIGVSNDELVRFQQQGIGLNVKPTRDPTAITAAFGGIHLFNRAPHPNTAKVFINWLLTQRAQEQVSRLIVGNSARRDVPSMNPVQVVDPARLSEYIPHQSEDALPELRLVDRLARELVR